MKIKNKKTGEIVDLCEGYLGDVGCGEYIVVKPVACLNKEYRYDSWEKFVSEWEECKEPKELKEFWYIDADGLVKETEYLTDGDKKDLVAFGNYFESGEKAEKAVEKLKAYKKLFDLNEEVDACINFSVMCSDEKSRGLIMDYLRIIFDMKGEE